MEVMNNKVLAGIDWSTLTECSAGNIGFSVSGF